VMRRDLVFLKLGGSLLGDKRDPRSFRRATVRRIGHEIRRALEQRPGMRIVLGHGGGGAAHRPAQEYRIREGLAGGGGWRGVAATRRGVLTMNRRVLDALAEADVFPVLLSPVAGVTARGGAIRSWDTRVMAAVLAAGQIPLVHGDVVLDSTLGFTICSTETLFAFLVRRLRPTRVLLACDVEGVYLDALTRTRPAPLPAIDRRNVAAVLRRIKAPAASPNCGAVWDVTGGMASKVRQLYEMARRHHRLEGRILSGLTAGAVEAALCGEAVGTAVRWAAAT